MHFKLNCAGNKWVKTKIPLHALANELSSAFNRGSQSGSLPSHQLTATEW